MPFWQTAVSSGASAPSTAPPPPPVTAPTLGKINPEQIDFSGKGSWDEGKAACEEYARQACAILGVPATYWVKGQVTIAGRESAYNADIYQVNTTDSNAKNVPGFFGGGNAPDGYKFQCSRGAWQCIPQTFAAYHVAGTSLKIYDPVASCAASMAYQMKVYGVARDGSNQAAKVQQADPNRPPKGY